MTKPLNELSITEAAKGLRAGEFSVRELWDACAKAAKERNGAPEKLVADGEGAEKLSSEIQLVKTANGHVQRDRV